MLSLNSIKNFIKVNTILLTFGYFQYFVETTSNNNFTIGFSVLLLRNYLLLALFEHSLQNVPMINQSKRIIPEESFSKEFDIFVVSSTLLENITTSIVVKSQLLNHNNINICNDILLFIPVSFIYEIIFDFFHYWFHRISHSNQFLYTKFHKIHHKHKNPIAIITFYQHPFDLIISNSIPTFISLYLLSFFADISVYQFTLLSIYKVYIEISGHIGKELKSSSFSQCVWLPKIFNIELYLKNHDDHHSKNNFNYSKRFSLWDKIFGTFQK